MKTTKQSFEYKGKTVTVEGMSYKVYGKYFKSEKLAKKYINRIQNKFTTFCNTFDIPTNG
jgi:hypothetical protein